MDDTDSHVQYDSDSVTAEPVSTNGLFPEEMDYDDGSTLDPDAYIQRGAQFLEARVKPLAGNDYIWLGIIEWHYRTQRPQHLATHLADAGNRVFYIALSFDVADENERFHIALSPHPGVFVIQLRIAGMIPEGIYGGFDKNQIAEITRALDEMIALLNVQAPTVVVEYPSWCDVAAGIPGALVVHDCLDHIAGFSNVPKEMATLEERLTANADLVVAASRPLADRLKRRDSVVVRNAADVDFFAKAARTTDMRAGRKRPVVGYFGAIAEWFEVEWIEACARARPEWDFVLIGSFDG